MNPEGRLDSSLLRQGFSNYAQQTSLHGWQYIEVSTTWWGKIFWVFVSCQVLMYLPSEHFSTNNSYLVSGGFPVPVGSWLLHH